LDYKRGETRRGEVNPMFLAHNFFCDGSGVFVKPINFFKLLKIYFSNIWTFLEVETASP
jgi:hypothetical protein